MCVCVCVCVWCGVCVRACVCVCGVGVVWVCVTLIIQKTELKHDKYACLAQSAATFHPMAMQFTSLYELVM